MTEAADPPATRIDPPGFLAWPAPAAVLAALPGARAVGGCVRDALAARAVHDVDVAAPLPPEAISDRLRAAGLKVFDTGLQHGTVTAVLDHQPVEVTSLRRDVATDGRHAEVAWTTDWREDAARRDFRINAMSLAADGRLWDYFGGREDLAAGRVRFVGDPATRLAEDYLRALRFFRFWARYGRGAPDPAALAAIRDAVPGLQRRIAPERVWMELKRLLAAPDPTGALALMQETGLLGAVLPEAGPLDPLATLAAAEGRAAAPPDPLLRLAALLDGHTGEAGLRSFARRNRLSGKEAETLRAMLAAPVPAGLAGLDDDALRRLLAAIAVAHPGLDARQVLAWRLRLADAAGGTVRAAAWQPRLDALPVPVFPVQGRDVLALGVPAGQAVGAWLAALRDWWLEGGCTADREACLAELRRRLRQAGAADGPTAPDADARS